MKPAMTAQQATFTDTSRSAFSLYRTLSVGDRSFAYFVGFETATVLLSTLPGMIGLAARSLVYPLFFNSCGKRPAVGRGVILRNPGAVSLGAGCIVDDYAVLDCRGQAASISIGNHVSIGRASAIAAKEGVVQLHDGVNIGSNCRIATQSRVTIGESTLVAAYAYIGPGNHQFGSADTPLISQEMEKKGGVDIGSHVWIGARATILDGVRIGDGAIVGAHSLVKEDVDPGVIVAGSPARVLGTVPGKEQHGR